VIVEANVIVFHFKKRSKICSIAGTAFPLNDSELKPGFSLRSVPLGTTLSASYASKVLTVVLSFAAPEGLIVTEASKAEVCDLCGSSGAFA
jgi:hypothetical protein